MNFWAETWKPTYCQKLIVVGALAFTRGGLNSAGFWSSRAGAGAWGCAPPICATARRAAGSAVEAAASEARPTRSAARRDIVERESRESKRSSLIVVPGGPERRADAPDMAPRPPTLGRTPAQPWRASKLTQDVSWLGLPRRP